LCDDNVVNILYFFSRDQCDICPSQGQILTYFKKKLQDKLLVFPINVDFEEDEDFIKIIRIRYNVTVMPTLVVNDQKYEGVVSRDELSKIICEQSGNKEKCLI
jgi:thiol-disulfide isomerase/thioredoxin